MVKLLPVGLGSTAQRFATASLLGLAIALPGCGKKDDLEIQASTNIQAVDETIKDDIPDKDGLFLSTVDQVLTKAKLGKIIKAQLWINTGKGSTTAYYSFSLKSGGNVYLTRPNDSKEIERLESGLRTVDNEPIYVIRGTEGSTGKIIDLATTIIPSALVATILITALVYYGRMIRGGKDGLKPVKPNDRFSDVRGYPKIVERLEKIVKYIKDKDKNKVEAELPKGVLLKGPPGTGKTLLARATAGEADIPFISVDTTGLIQMIGGVGVKKLEAAINEGKKLAEKYGGAILFFDEIDAIGITRTNAVDGVTDERTRLLTCLITGMDGFKSNSGVIFMAATNRSDMLDPALIRRFTMPLDVPLPIVSSQRKDILDKYLSKKEEKGLLTDDVDIKWLADNTEGFSGADLENLVKKAAIIAFENDQSQITKANFKDAITEIAIGMESGAQVKEKDLEVIVRHETGHGIVGKACNRKVDGVSRMPRGNSLGHVMLSGGLYSKVLPNKSELLEALLILMGGRAAELELLPSNGETIGAGADYREARNILRLMLQGAMFPGHVASDYSDPSKELSESDNDFVTKVLDKALLVSREIIKVVPRDNIEALVQDYLGLEEELTGEQAEALFSKHLKDVEWENIYKLVKGFIKNPVA